jgi:large subunit ribosomal protein L22e
MPSKTHSKVRNNPAVKDSKSVTYVVDLKQPIEDGVFELGDFENHMKEKIKLNGKKGSEHVEISTKEHRLNITTKILFSKRYIKFLAKKYLKKQDLRDYLRVISTDKNTYTIKFVNISEGAEGEAK